LLRDLDFPDLQFFQFPVRNNKLTPLAVAFRKAVFGDPAFELDT
jgi:hypothetical protein